MQDELPPTDIQHDVDRLDTQMPQGKVSGYARELDQRIGTLPISPEDRIRVAGMLMAGAIRRYLVARALTGKALNWRERAQLIDTVLKAARQYLRTSFIKDGEFTDDEPTGGWLG